MHVQVHYSPEYWRHASPSRVFVRAVSGNSGRGWRKKSEETGVGRWSLVRQRVHPVHENMMHGLLKWSGGLLNATVVGSLGWAIGWRPTDIFLHMRVGCGWGVCFVIVCQYPRQPRRRRKSRSRKDDIRVPSSPTRLGCWRLARLSNKPNVS